MAEASLAPAMDGAVAAPPRSRRFDLVSHRNWFFALSLVIIVPGIVSMLSRGFLLGIDFQGGTQYFLTFRAAETSAQVERAVTAVGETGTVQQTSSGVFILRTGPSTPLQQAAFQQALEKKLGTTINRESKDYAVSAVGPTIAQELVNTALVAVVLASLAILGLLAFRFRKVQGGWRSGMQFGGSALLALLHDVFVLTGLYSILGRVLGLQVGQIDSLFLTAVLTVVGFSVHDTIVVFDRIRENMVTSSRLTFEQTVNLSVMQTAARSIITSFTVVLVLLSLFLFGGDTLRGFVLALMIGIVSGTYSSIFNASPLLVVWRRLQPVR